MKTTFKFIIAALSAIAVFSSCQKELTKEIAANTTDGVRIITVQFDNSTKASLGSDGFTPKFADGDKIRVSNNTESKECEVSVSGDVATFTTDLTGNLTAIYPAAAAAFTGTSPITDSFFKVSASQDGDIAKAIIAKAEIADASSCATATFRCQTALFQITPPSGVTTFKIKSLNTIDASTGQRSTTANAVAINTEGADEAAKREITVTVPSGGTAYVSLVPGVNLTDLSFEYTVTGATYDGAMKGIPASKITGGLVDATAANTKYTIGNTNWHPYVTIGGKKWATMNIGATSETDYGHYFFWGGTVGYKHDGSKWVKESDNEELSEGFSQNNDPHYDNTNSKYTKYTGTNGDNKPVLELADDAATANWGGSWRMPTKEEFDALCSLTKEWKTNYKNSGVNGCLFKSGDEELFFLPAAAYGASTGLTNVDVGGYYWSSSLNTDDPYKAYYLYFYDGGAGTGGSNRYYGRSVRALSE